MRTDDERRIPVPTQGIFTARRLRLNAHALASALVVTHDVPALQLGIDDVWIFRIDLRAEAVTALRYKPVRVDDARSVARARWPPERVVVLRAAEHVVEGRRVVG